MTMDKREFVDTLINNIRSEDISLIIGKYIELVRKGRSYLGLCPFHNDTKIGSFVVTPHKGIFKCFTCNGVAGDAIKFVSLYLNVSYVEASFIIGSDLNLISQSEYEEYFVRKRYSAKDVAKIERKYEELNKQAMKEEIASDEDLDKVYTLFFKSANLSDGHENHLLGERKIKQEMIKEVGYKTFPTRYAMKSFIGLLKEAGLNEDILIHIPGFYQEKNSDGGWKWTFTKNEGIMIPITNEKGQIIRIQVRKDVVKNGESRYVWFSSSFALFDDKYRFGTSAGSPVSVIYPKEITNGAIVITEGHFKAQVIAEEMGSVVISVQGVSSWSNVGKMVEKIRVCELASKLMTEKAKKYAFPSQFYIMYDSDMAYKFQVYGQLKKMSDMLEVQYPDIKNIYYIYWNHEGLKGFDDLVHGVEDYKKHIMKYPKGIWDTQYADMEKKILEEKNVTHLKEITQKDLEQYVLDNIINKLKSVNKKAS